MNSLQSSAYMIKNWMRYLNNNKLNLRGYLLNIASNISTMFPYEMNN